MTFSALFASVEAAVSFLGQVTVKAALLLALLSLADRMLDRRYASWRNLLWKMGIVSVALLPALSLILPSLYLPLPVDTMLSPETGILRGETRPPDVSPSRPDENAFVPLPGDSETSMSIPSTRSVAEAASPWSAGMAAIYATGAAAVLLWLLAGLHQAISLGKRTTPVMDRMRIDALETFCSRLGIRRSVRLGESDEIGVPTQMGLFRPAIILPASMVSARKYQAMRAAIAHELAHVHRLDYAFNVLCGMVLMLHWFNPLVWFAVHRFQETSEHVCDDWAIALLGQHEIYADTLLDVAARMKRGTGPILGAGMARRPRIVERIDRIITLAGDVSPRIGDSAGKLCTFGLLIVAAFLASSTLQAEARIPSARFFGIGIDDGFLVRADEWLPGIRQTAKERILGLSSRFDAWETQANAAETLPEYRDADLIRYESAILEERGDGRPAADRGFSFSSLLAAGSAWAQSGEEDKAGIEISEPQRQPPSSKSFTITILDYWDNNEQVDRFPSAIPELISYLEKATNIETQVRWNELSLSGLTENTQASLLYVTGAYARFQLKDDLEKKKLGMYLKSGGLLFADEIRHSLSDRGLKGRGAGVTGTTFDRSLKSLISDPLVLGDEGRHWQKILHSHPLYTSYWNFPEGPPLDGAPDGDVRDLEMLQIRGRTVVIFSDLNISSYWGDPLVKARQRGLRFGVNLIVFAMSQQAAFR